MRKSFQVVAWFSLLLTGCSGSVSRIPISGTVKINGTPASLVVIRFHPVGSTSKLTHGDRVVADENGTFTLGQADTNTGLPAGKYKITFSQTLIAGKPSLGGSGKKHLMQDDEKEAVPEVHLDPDTTPESIQVSRSSTKFDFDLQAK